jgi:hypothetical protein
MMPVKAAEVIGSVALDFASDNTILVILLQLAMHRWQYFM